METPYIFPTCFSGVEDLLHRRFRKVDMELIEESIQYAKGEYWRKKIDIFISNDNDALSWLLEVSKRYILREIGRSAKLCNLREATNIYSDYEIEIEIAQRDVLDYIDHHLSTINSTIVMKHAMGFSLAEVSKAEHLSISAVKQRHSRIIKTIRKKFSYLYY